MNLKDFQNKFHDLINGFQHAGMDFLAALEVSIEANGGKILRDASASAVVAAEAAGGTGEEKAKAAFEAVVGVLTTEGLPIVINAVKGAIEAAVANMKA